VISTSGIRPAEVPGSTQRYGSFSTVWLAKVCLKRSEFLTYNLLCLEAVSCWRFVQASLTGDNQILPRNHPGPHYIVDILNWFRPLLTRTRWNTRSDRHESSRTTLRPEGWKNINYDTSKRIRFQAMMVLAYMYRPGIAHARSSTIISICLWPFRLTSLL
jgi:hypothetical protein